MIREIPLTMVLTSFYKIAHLCDRLIFPPGEFFGGGSNAATMACAKNENFVSELVLSSSEIAPSPIKNQGEGELAPTRSSKRGKKRGWKKIKTCAHLIKDVFELILGQCGAFHVFHRSQLACHLLSIFLAHRLHPLFRQLVLHARIIA